MSEIIDYQVGSGTQLGSGFDLLGRAVKFSPLAPVSVTTEGSGPDETELKFIETSADLSQFLQVGAEGAFDAVAFKASAKSKFVLETKINKYSLLFVVHSRIIKGVEIVSQPTLNEKALGLATQGKHIAFRKAYGDYFTSALTRGGELFGMIKISTSSETRRQELQAELNASGIGWSAHADLESRIASKVARKDIQVTTRISGITGYKTPTTPEALFKLAQDFPNLVRAKGTPIKVELRPISDFPEYQEAVHQFDADTRYALWELSNHYIDYQMLWNDLDFMKSPAGRNRFDFDTVSKATVATEQAKVGRQLKALTSLSERLVLGKIKPNNPQVARFTHAHKFQQRLRIPNPIEQFMVPTVSVFPLTRTRGDADMAGHNPHVKVRADLMSPSNRLIELKTYVKMKEDRKDWTTFEGTRKTTLLDLRRSGLKIVDYWPRKGVVTTQAGKNDHAWHWYGGTDLIKRAHCRSDTKGRETGRIGADVVEFEPVNVVLAPLDRGPAPARTRAVFKKQQKALSNYWVRRVPLSR